MRKSQITRYRYKEYPFDLYHTNGNAGLERNCFFSDITLPPLSIQPMRQIDGNLRFAGTSSQ